MINVEIKNEKNLALILSFVVLTSVLPLSGFSDNQTNISEGTDPNNMAVVPENTEDYMEDDIALSSIVDGVSYECLSLNSIPDGIYAFKNLGNENRWMDIERNKTEPGAHVQQYSNGGISPTLEYTESCLFKVTRVGNTQRYVIRLMLNEGLSFGFSDDGYVVTKEIPANDNDVSVSDTFTISYSVRGYIIKPAGSTCAICANDTDASGANEAPASRLIKELPLNAGDHGIWVIEGYRSQPKDGVYAFKNMGNANRWMDIERNKTVPGYHVQQYANNDSSPATNCLTSGLFKVTQIDNTGRYTIRLMLNQNLSFGFSDDGYVLTKTIAAKDEDVLISDTFYICFTNGGYIIRPYESEYVIGANVTEASGASGKPASYLIKTDFCDIDKYSIWRMEGYQTLFDSGVYYISNSYGITEGSPERILETDYSSYTEGTLLQQWKSDTIESDWQLSQMWIVRRVYENYYTIASSIKQNMYISWDNQNLDLMEVSIYNIASTDEILWKFEGNESIGYTITSKKNSSVSITVPSSTTNGLLLQVSNKETTTDGRNIWKMNRIEEAYIISICVLADLVKTTRSNNIMEIGHSWIVFENLSTVDLRLIHINVEKNDYITIGKWGNQDDYKGMWYNVERNFNSFHSATVSTGDAAQLSIVVNYDKIDELNAILKDYANDGYDPFSNNCVHLACEIWKTFTSVEYDEIYPSKLQEELLKNVKVIKETKITHSNYYGYYDGQKLVTGSVLNKP